MKIREFKKQLEDLMLAYNMSDDYEIHISDNPKKNPKMFHITEVRGITKGGKIKS